MILYNYCQLIFYTFCFVLKQGVLFNVLSHSYSCYESYNSSVHACRRYFQACLLPVSLLHWFDPHVPEFLRRDHAVALGRVGSGCPAFEPGLEFLPFFAAVS